MSQENVEIVRQVYEAVARRKPNAVLGLYDPEVEWDATQNPYRALLGQDLYRGHEGLRQFFLEYRDPWASIQDECEELIDAGGERVISVVTSRARGKASGADVQSRRQYGIWTVKQGKIVHVTWRPTRAEALEAAGLSD
jgi:ketosteroid isomerase-like protein